MTVLFTLHLVDERTAAVDERARIWDSLRPKDQRREGSVRESSRRYTQHSIWNKDPSAFGKLQFVE